MATRNTLPSLNRISTAGGITADLPIPQTQPVLVAPTTTQGFNSLRGALIPIACWRLDEVRFEFDSSFVLSTSSDEFQALDNLRKMHPGAPLSIFGHADPVGDDSYNKQLSGRRAQAVHAVLVRN